MASTTFPLFPTLPPELRLHIWLTTLNFDTPRAYVFHIDSKVHRWSVKAVQLVPERSTCHDWDFSGPTWERRWPDLIVSTQATRALLATCRESRAAALQHSPDKLPFSTVRLEDVRRGSNSSDSSGGIPLPNVDPAYETDEEEEARRRARPSEPTRYWLPFSAERDIIVVGLPNPEWERVIAKYARDGGTPLLEAVQNLAFFAADCWRGRHGVDSQFFSRRLVRPWDPPNPTCSCGLLDCSSCSKDPLLQLLATVCPRIKTLSFAVLDRMSEPLGRCIGHKPYFFELVPPCACPSGTTHSWPMVQLMNKFRERCVWYPEGQKLCPFPALPSLVDIRRRWHPNWPYYESLRHVQVRVLRCVEVEKGKDQLVSGWMVPHDSDD